MNIEANQGQKHQYLQKEKKANQTGNKLVRVNNNKKVPLYLPRKLINQFLRALIYQNHKKIDKN